MSTIRKLRLGPLPKTESIKLTFACSASLKADLDRYAALHAETYGEKVDAMTLIPHMLAAFMAGDRGASWSRHAQEHRANRSCSDQPRSPRGLTILLSSAAGRSDQRPAD